jgi:hypothetical protein
MVPIVLIVQVCDGQHFLLCDACYVTYDGMWETSIAGTTSIEGSASCSSCDPGYYSSTSGQPSCSPCPLRTAGTVASRTTCALCVGSTFSDILGGNCTLMLNTVNLFRPFGDADSSRLTVFLVSIARECKSCNQGQYSIVVNGTGKANRCLSDQNFFKINRNIHKVARY